MTELDALEKLFIAEIEDRLPFQSRAAIYKRLREQNLIHDMVVKFGMVTVTGYQLTHAGRMLYCMSCKDEPEPEESS